MYHFCAQFLHFTLAPAPDTQLHTMGTGQSKGAKLKGNRVDLTLTTWREDGHGRHSGEVTIKDGDCDDGWTIAEVTVADTRLA